MLMRTTLKNVAMLMLGIAVTASVNAQKPSPLLLTPSNHTLVLIDNEGQMAFATASMPIDQLRNNTAIVAGASKIFNVATVVTTVAEKSFSGPVFREISEFYPANTYIDRTSMNTWEDV